MQIRKRKSAKFKIRINSEDIDEHLDRKSFIAKRQLEMISSELGESSTFEGIRQDQPQQRKNNDQGIRTTDNSVKESTNDLKDLAIPYKKNVQSRYLHNGYFKGQKYSSDKREAPNSNRLFISSVKFDATRLKSRSQASIRLQQLIKQKKKKNYRLNKSPRKQFASQRCFEPEIVISHDFLPISHRQKHIFYTFNDVFENGKRPKMITMPDEEELNLKEEILRPEIFRIVAKIRNNEERKKLAKETKLRYKFKAK